jgi:hypothetical protein
VYGSPVPTQRVGWAVLRAEETTIGPAVLVARSSRIAARPATRGQPEARLAASGHLKQAEVAVRQGFRKSACASLADPGALELLAGRVPLGRPMAAVAEAGWVPAVPEETAAWSWNYSASIDASSPEGQSEIRARCCSEC